jgi:hypothetical protein
MFLYYFTLNPHISLQELTQSREIPIEESALDNQ